MKKLACSLLLLSSLPALAERFVETLPVYGIVQPDEVSTIIGVRDGIISKLRVSVGDNVKTGEPVLEVLEKETVRVYRSTINGVVAKLHVTTNAAVTIGMPLVTAINPLRKRLEISISPTEAQNIIIGSRVYEKDGSTLFGNISKLSPLVDPDTGAVPAVVHPLSPVKNFIGDVIALNVGLRAIEDCKIEKISELDQFIDDFRVEAISGTSACLQPRKKDSSGP